jgi:LysM repeat protein
MVRWKRLFYYLMLNVLVSACTTLAVLVAWERYHQASLLETIGVSLSTPTLASQLVDTPEMELPTSTPSLQPTLSLATYRVAAGDTLGQIAEKFGVSVQKLMEINGLTDPDSLGSGQVLFVPITASPTEAVSQNTPAPDPLPTNNVDEEIRIIIANVFGMGDLNTERVRIERKGEGDLGLAGWILRNEHGTIYTFPNLTLFSGGSIDVYTKNGPDSVVALHWGLDKPVWGVGEVISLVDPSGVVRSVFIIP